MARELKHIDISSTPELLRLAEEVQRSRRPQVLQRDREDLAAIIPLTARTPLGRREQLIEAQIWADVGVTDPTDVWADYDPAAVGAALQQAQGALAGLDHDELIRDLYEARDQDTTTCSD